jgi:hypothetical protein
MAGAGKPGGVDVAALRVAEKRALALWPERHDRREEANGLWMQLNGPRAVFVFSAKRRECPAFLSPTPPHSQGSGAHP